MKGDALNHKIVSLHAGYDYQGHTVDAYMARPVAPGTYPGLVLISGMSGLNSFQREMTRVFARAGFVTLSPDLFDGYSAPDHPAALLAKNSLDVNLTVERLAAGAEWLRDLPWVEDGGKVGVSGFCLGGGLALYCLGRSDRFDSGVIFYQSLFPDPAELAGIKTKIQCHYGTDDHSTPEEEVVRFRTEIDRLGIQNEVHFYEGIGHSFLNPRQEDSTHREEAASLALGRAFVFLHDELGGDTDESRPEQTEEEVDAASTIDA
jgi:carboxymethylenebutenolidase